MSASNQPHVRKGADVEATMPGHACCEHVKPALFVCAERERELLELKGPCTTKRCRLHYAHSGPCALTTITPSEAYL